ncbi:MAG: TIGR01459 family HAD-type hydrolase [Alphaproteobacteria bacterium]|nr:TIGR01459 family HAD-type hydrolase [Alphaproteobacteria bacterium SS10]
MTNQPALAETSEIAIHDGLSGFIDVYDAAILDLWGVLHDGIRAYDHAEDALKRLRAAGKKICLLSNVPRRLGPTRAKLDGLGLTEDLYDHLVTSGEATHQALTNPSDDWHRKLGDAAYPLAPFDEAVEMLEGTGKQPVKSVGDADFLLAIGISDVRETLDDYRPALDAGLARNLPLLCANPDLIVNSGNRLAICAGTFAKYYQEQGGDVAYHGKPHGPVYDLCREHLGLAADQRILAVGDSFATDLTGAKRAGLDACLVAGGIHLADLGGEFGAPVSAPDVDRLAAKYGLAPDYVVPVCRW